MSRYSHLNSYLHLLLISFFCFDLANAQLQVDEWQQDVRFLADQLPKRHKNLFAEVSREQFVSDMDRLVEKLPTYNEIEVQLRLAEIITSVGDGHTGIQLSYDKLHYLPVQMRWFKDGIYVVATTRQNDKLLGGRVVRIGGKGINDVTEAIASLTPHDNESFLKYSVPRNLLASAEALKFAGVIEATDKVQFTVARDDQESTEKLVPISQSELRAGQWIVARDGDSPMYTHDDQKPYWFRRLDESNAIYLKFRRCQNMFGFAALVAKLSKEIKEQEPEKLIIDLRLNPGGNSLVMKPLTLYLKSSKLNRDGRLIVIIGRRTFSSAVLNAIELKQSTNAKLIGEPTGGKPNHFGEVRQFELPNSGLKVNYSTKYFQDYKAPAGEDPNPPSLNPDVTIEPSFQDWANGTDPVLDSVLSKTDAH